MCTPHYLMTLPSPLATDIHAFTPTSFSRVSPSVFFLDCTVLFTNASQFSLSVHYRQVPDPTDVDEVHKIVHAYAADEPEIVVKAGKKVGDALRDSLNSRARILRNCVLIHPFHDKCKFVKGPTSPLVV